MDTPSYPLVAKFEAELATRTSTLGHDHLDVADTLNALALANHHMANNQEEALRCHTEALHIFNLRKGEPDYPYADVALTLSDIGNVHRKKGEYDAAATAYMNSVRTYRLCGTDDEHPRVHSVLMCLTKLKGLIESGDDLTKSESQQSCGGCVEMGKQKVSPSSISTFYERHTSPPTSMNKVTNSAA